MSNGLRDALGFILLDDRDAIDGRDPWDWEDEITEITELPKGVSTYPWLDFSGWKPKERECDCGGKVAKTTHAEYCSTRRN